MQKPQLSLLDGPIISTSVKLGMPIIIGHLLIIMYNVIDTIFISFIDRQSTALMSGVGLVFPIFFLFLAISSGLLTGNSSLVARAIGEKNQNVLDRIADSSLLIMNSAAVLTLIFVYSAGEPIIKLLAGKNISETAIRNGLHYLYFLAPGLALLIIQMSLLGILQGEGLTQYTGIAMSFSTLINIILDPIFIFYFKMGVAGAALATSISIFLAVIYVVSVFITNKSSILIHWNILKAKAKIILEILRIGIPQTLQLIALSLSFMVLNKIVGSLDELKMAAWVIFGRSSEFLMLISYGISNSTLAMIGQNFGNRNMKRVQSIYAKNIYVVVIGTIIIAVLMNVFAKPLFSFFTDVEEIIRLCVFQLRIVSFSYIGVAVTIIVSSSFQATGKAMPGFYITFFRMGLLSIPLAYISVYFWDLGFKGLLFSLAGVNLFAALPTYAIGYYYLKYLKPKALEI